MNYLQARKAFPVGTLVTTDLHPGTWRVNQPVGTQCDVHLVPDSPEAKIYAETNQFCGAIVFADQCKSIDETIVELLEPVN